MAFGSAVSSTIQLQSVPHEKMKRKKRKKRVERRRWNDPRGREKRVIYDVVGRRIVLVPMQSS